MNIRIAALCGGWLWCTALYAQTSGVSTNNDTLSPVTINIINAWVADQPDPHWNLFEWIKYESGKNGQENFIRFFGPLTTYNYAQASLGTKHRGGQDRAESKGEEWFANTIGDTFIDSFTSWYNFDQLKRPENPAVNFGVKFVQGTLSVDEGRLEPDSLEPDSVSVNENWAKSFLSSEKTKYGANILNANPYLYFAHSFGRRKNGLPYLITDTRLRLMFLSSRVGSLRFDQGATVPVDPSTQVTIGYQFYPMETMGKETSPSLTARLTYVLDRNGLNENLFYCSTKINDKEQMVLIGLSCDTPFKTLSRLFGTFR